MGNKKETRLVGTDHPADWKGNESMIEKNHEGNAPETTCPICGSPLPDRSAPCPNCLMKLANETTGYSLASSESGDQSGEETPSGAQRGVPKSSEESASKSASKRPVPPAVETLQEAFEGSFEILDLIGRGGMSAVYKARQTDLDRIVAIKILYGELARNESFVARFRREGKVLARLSHSNIVTIHEFGSKTIRENGTESPILFLVMEYVDGVNLRQAMRSERFSPEQALTLIPMICDALQYAHDEGVIHRDIKPENILLDVKGRIKLADFGICQRVSREKTPNSSGSGTGGETTETHITKSGIVLGTPNYIAPEQFDTPEDVDQRADIYSLGVVFYELLTGERPNVPVLPPSFVSETPAELDQIVMRALERERNRRWQTAEEMKTEVETTLHTLQQGKGKVVRQGRRRSPRNLKSLLQKSPLFVNLLLLIAVIAILFRFDQPQDPPHINGLVRAGGGGFLFLTALTVSLYALIRRQKRFFLYALYWVLPMAVIAGLGGFEFVKSFTENLNLHKDLINLNANL